MTLFFPPPIARPVTSKIMSRSSVACSSGKLALGMWGLVSGLTQKRQRHSPVSSDLHLCCMCPKKLYVWVAMIQKGYHKPPCLRSFLDLEDLLLNSPLVLGREVVLRRVSLLYELCAGLA